MNSQMVPYQSRMNDQKTILLVEDIEDEVDDATDESRANTQQEPAVGAVVSMNNTDVEQELTRRK